MEELIQERSSVIHYKNKMNWMEYGERNAPNYFSIFNIEMLQKNNLLKLVTNDGVRHDSQNDILKE